VITVVRKLMEVGFNLLKHAESESVTSGNSSELRDTLPEIV